MDPLFEHDMKDAEQARTLLLEFVITGSFPAMNDGGQQPFWLPVLRQAIRTVLLDTGLLKEAQPARAEAYQPALKTEWEQKLAEMELDPLVIAQMASRMGVSPEWMKQYLSHDVYRVGVKKKAEPVAQLADPDWSHLRDRCQFVEDHEAYITPHTAATSGIGVLAQVLHQVVQYLQAQEKK